MRMQACKTDDEHSAQGLPGHDPTKSVLQGNLYYEVTVLHGEYWMVGKTWEADRWLMIKE